MLHVGDSERQYYQTVFWDRNERDLLRKGAQGSYVSGWHVPSVPFWKEKKTQGPRRHVGSHLNEPHPPTNDGLL